MNPTPRFLILRGGAIGDFVMTMPVLEALRKRWPSCRIEVIGYPHIASLALVSGLADRIRSLDEAQVALLFVPEHPLRGPLADYIRGFDVIISYLYDPDDSVRTSLEAAGARLVLTGSPRMGTEPAARQLMKPLESLAITPDQDPVPRLCLPETLRAEGRRLATTAGPNPVLIHPGSGSPNKNWPFGRFLEVARRLRTAGYHPLFSFGEADHHEATLYAASHESFPTLPPLELPALAGVCSAVRLYVGNDSGITHMAAATGVPTIAIFGPSDPRVWASRAPTVRVIEAPDRTPEALQTISVETVWKAIGDLLKGTRPLGSSEGT
jgi:ADP-heptose:LPS heptosyltransferase